MKSTAGVEIGERKKDPIEIKVKLREGPASISGPEQKDGLVNSPPSWSSSASPPPISSGYF